ncbi:replicative DNA helicase [Stutzerimonas nitrititolerans]|uniref:replicative DNA helicase n=1 Tax=Stutzerimonas nitrititolerans TaxID=2482751 RepID=UPI0028AEF97A|nr:replicative DNA helicase [Stutzerimonas nitrititolerans]
MREPYSLESEHAVLGAMMQRPELIDVLAQDLTADDFYLADHAEIFRAILNLQAANSPIDFLTVAEALQTLLNGDSPLAYCAEIVTNTPSVANARAYAEIIKERSVDRSLILCGDRIAEIALGDAPTAEKIAAAQAEVLGIDGEAASAEVVKAADVLTDHVEELQRRSDRGDELDGLSTGIADLDEKLQGLKPEQLIIIAGRPAMGKTTLAMNIAADVALRQKKQTLVISLEMSNGQLMDRFLAAEGKIPLQLIKNGSAPREYGTELNSAAYRIKNAPLYMSDRASMTISRIRAAARRHKRRYGLDLIVIDYLQLMDSDARSGNRTEEVSQMSRHAKLMAKELKCPVVMLSQLSRQCEQRPNKRPVPADLRESGAIEQDADIIVFVYRDEVYNPDTEYKGVAEIIIGKGRDIETGTVRTAFLGQYSRFEQLDGRALHEMHERAEEKKRDNVSSLAGRYGSQKRGGASA